MRDELKRFINEELLIGEDTEVGDDDELLIDGIIDSLGVTRLVGHISSRYGLRVPPEDITIENFRTVSVLADYVESRSAAAS